ncbi:hypothetical protein A9Q99_09465 [Gammaproteobacteria bacterium 45_16_T64]|nr:hypothetical protein A9Q99_09465 [Gammaproteobacteria bacterium 45_16_T64]
MLHDDINRRDFFRLEDRVHLIKRPIEKHLIHEDPYHSSFGIPKEALLFSQLRSIESDTQNLLPLIKDSNIPIANYLKALDQKIDFITQYLIADGKGGDILQKENVSLSEGGISFLNYNHIEPSSFMHLTMILFPSHGALSAIGQVKDSTLLDEEQPSIYRIGLEFTTLLEQDRKQLSRHIRRKQSMAIRDHTPKSDEKR